MREKTENELRKKTDQFISSQKELQRLYAESEEARKSLVSILEDVSEKENALRESEEKYRGLVTNVKLGIFRHSKELKGLVLEANPAMEEITGYSRQELLGMRVVDFYVHPEERLVLLEELAATREKVRKELRWRKKDGSEITVAVTNVAVRDNGGEILYIDGILEDITACKQAEERIQHLTDVLRAIRNVNQLIVREKDRQRLIKGVCETLVETRGYHYAWVALFGESGELVASAEAGFGEGFAPTVEYMKGGKLPPCVRTALGQSGAVVIDDASGDCTGCPLSEKHPRIKRMIVRVEHEGRVYGLLKVSTVMDLDADEEERSLFQEVAGDIAFALHSIELEDKRKRAEEALRESEESYRVLVNLGAEMREAIVMLQDNELGEGIQTFANDEWLRITGYSRKKLLGMSFFDLVHPKHREASLGRHRKKVSGEVIPGLFDISIITRDGTEVVVELTSAYTMYKGKRANVCYIRDITERKRAEEALQKAHDTLEIRVQERTTDLTRANEALRVEISERRRMESQIAEHREYLVSVLRHAPDAIVTADSSYRIVEWNPGAERLFGFTPAEARGKDCADLVTDHDVPQAREQARFFAAQALLGQAIPPTEVVRYRKDGAPVNAILSTSPIMIGDQVGGVVLIYTDITERKRAEEELRVKEMQLIHAGRLSSLGEMATGVAHEINQPLAIISMVAEGRLRDIQRGRFDVSILPQELEDILKNVRRIDRIITHMQTFARRAGEWDSVEPEKMLDNIFLLLGEQFRIHGISISREIEAGLPAIRVDMNQLEQVFVNILTNARQVLDERAEEAERDGKAFKKRLVCGISRAKEAAGEYVVFEFADNAYGVPDEMKTRIFDPFFTTKEAGQGTGLGLSLAYGIVTRSLGGRIWVEDNEMGGASFKVALRVGELEARGRSSRDADN